MTNQKKLLNESQMYNHLRRRFGSADIFELRREAELGLIPSVRIGDTFAFDPDAVEAALLALAAPKEKAYRNKALPKHVAAKELGVSDDYLDRLIKEGRIPHTLVGDFILVNPAAVAVLLKAGK